MREVTKLVEAKTLMERYYLFMGFYSLGLVGPGAWSSPSKYESSDLNKAGGHITSESNLLKKLGGQEK